MELYRSSFFFSAMDILGEHSFVVLLFCSTFSRNGVCFIYGHLLFYRGVIQRVNYQVQILLDNVILTCEHVLWTWNIFFGCHLGNTSCNIWEHVIHNILDIAECSHSEPVKVNELITHYEVTQVLGSTLRLAAVCPIVTLCQADVHITDYNHTLPIIQCQVSFLIFLLTILSSYIPVWVLVYKQNCISLPMFHVMR